MLRKVGAFFLVFYSFFSSLSLAAAESVVEEKKSGNFEEASFSKHRTIQLQFVEEFVFRDKGFELSNELEIGFYTVDSLFTFNLGFLYGGTDKIEGDPLYATVTHNGIEVGHYVYDSSYYGMNLALHWHKRMFFDGFYPYLGLSYTNIFKSEVDKSFEENVSSHDLRVSNETRDLGRIKYYSIDLGAEYRYYFWKIFAVGAGMGATVPFKFIEGKNLNSRKTDDAKLNESIDRHQAAMTNKTLNLFVNFGFNF